MPAPGGRLAPALALCASTPVDVRERPRARVDLVHAHEGHAVHGHQLAGRLDVPLVVSLGRAEDLPDGVRPDLVLVPPGAPTTSRDGEPRRQVPDPVDPDDVPAGTDRWEALSRRGAHAVAADLDRWYAAVATGAAPHDGRPLPSPPTITVVVPTHERPELLARTLAALAGQTYPAACIDVVVVDDASTDAGTPRVLRDAAGLLDGRLHVLRNPSNLGAGPSRNRGVAAATGTIVAFTDDDCVPSPTWLELLATAWRDDLALVQGRTRPDPAVPVGPTDRSQWTSAPHGLYETCNIAYARSALAALDDEPFDVALQDRIRRHVGRRVVAHGFGEDTDLGWRIRESGHHAAFVGAAVVDHHVFTSGVAHLLRRSMLAAAFPLLVQRHPGLRDTLLWRRTFLGRRHALLLLAVGGALVGPRTGTVAATAYLADVLHPTRPGRRRRLRAAPVRVLRDVVEVGALAYGSARAREVVL